MIGARHIKEQARNHGRRHGSDHRNRHPLDSKVFWNPRSENTTHENPQDFFPQPINKLPLIQVSVKLNRKGARDQNYVSTLVRSSRAEHSKSCRTLVQLL